MSPQKPVTAREALKSLRLGNKRFVARRKSKGYTTQRDATWLEIKPRGPFAIILSCSDSRAPAELLFDQGLGDLFVIRVAGNIVAPSQVGSVEFAAATTKAQLVVVMGHTQCQAIQATLDAIKGKKGLPTENIAAIVNRIRPHVEKIAKKNAIRANVLASADHLRHGSRFLEDQIRKKKLVVVGAEYCLETGVVDFFDNPLARSP